MRCRHRGTHERTDPVVSDAPRPLFSSTRPGRPFDRTARFRRGRQGRRRARQHGGGAFLRRSRGCRRGDRPAAHDRIAKASACGRKDGNDGVGRQAMAPSDGGIRLWPANCFDDTMAGQCIAVGRTSGSWRWTTAVASGIDPGEGRGVRRVCSRSVRCHGSYPFISRIWRSRG